MSSAPELSHDPLLLAALLDGFSSGDRKLFLTAVGTDLAGLIGAEHVTPLPGEEGLWRLTAAAQATAVERIRKAGPRAEITLRTQLFSRLCALIDTGQDLDRDRLEVLAFYQLSRLFVLHYLRLEWQVLGELLAATAPPRVRRHQQRLQLYRAFVAVRTGDYAVGGRELEALMAADDLEWQVRMDATIALGHMRRFLTQYDRALQTFTELSELARVAGNELYRAQALYNQGTIYNELERYEQALEAVLESQRIFAEQGDAERLAYASYSVGLNAMYLGRWELARTQYEEAIALFEQLQMSTLLAAAYWGQGFLSLMLGDAKASEEAYRKAIVLATSPERAEHLFAMDSWWQLGILYFTQGRYEDAAVSYAEGLSLAAVLQHEQRAATLHFLRARALQALARVEEAESAYAAAMASVEALRGAHTREDVKISVLGTTQQVYEAAALFALDQGRAAEAFEVAERARSRAFLDSLAARDPELASAYAQPTAGLAEVQAALPFDALLLAYYTTGVLPAGEHFYHSIPPENKALLDHLLLPAGVVLFAVTSRSLEVHRLALDPNTVRPTAGDPRPGRHLLRDRVLAALYDRLIGPVEPLVEGRSSLFIVPHGPLHAVPFMALRSRGGRHLVRAGGPALALAPSATVLVRNCLGRTPAPATAEALALGFNGSGEAGLRFAEPEAELAARALGARALTGDAARAEAVLSAARRLRALHIAGHAAFTPDDPLDSYLALAGGDRLSARAIMGSAGLRADLVVLSACTSGLTHVVPGDELLGLQRAWLYAGAAAVVCALWEAPDLVTLLVMERFYDALSTGSGPGAALRDAVVAVRALTGRELGPIFERWRAMDPALAAPGALPVIPLDQADRPLYADPVHWAPFMLIGRP